MNKIVIFILINVFYEIAVVNSHDLYLYSKIDHLIKKTKEELKSDCLIIVVRGKIFYN